MIRTLTSLLIVVLTVGGSYGCAGQRATRDAAAPRRLTVMTYNIHHGAGMDRKLDIARIARVIADANADLVALQEVDAETRRVGGAMQAEELAGLLNMHHAFGPAMDYDGGKYGNAILSRHRIIESTTAALPYTPGNLREPRAAIAATVELPGGRRIVLISTHLDHTRASPDRLPQAKAINQHLGDVRPPAILAGDFNCAPASEPMAELANWTMVSGADAPTSPADQPRVTIDHVLVKPREKWRLIEAKVIEEPVASDHRPVVVTLELADD